MLVAFHNVGAGVFMDQTSVLFDLSELPKKLTCRVSLPL